MRTVYEDKINGNQHHSDNRLPVYNIKAVARLVGLLPVTLRAWERRYGLPTPQRGTQGYRLYSDYDLRTLRWLKNQLDAGLSISRAVEYLNELRETGQDPVEQPAQAKPIQAASLNHLAKDLLESLISFNEARATDIMRRAFGIYAVDQVLTDVVQPVLVEIGERWHRGELPIAVEHYATQFFMQNLMTMLTASAPPVHNDLIFAACAPGELHQIGILTLVVMLRWRGWDVRYLGPDLKLDRLEEALNPVKPRLLLFTATRLEAAEALGDLPSVLQKFSEPAPIVVLGGQAFQQVQLPESVPAVYLNASAVEMVDAIETMLGASSNSFGARKLYRDQ